MPEGIELFSLKGKTALVTGATGHLGQAMARCLAAAGATVYVNSRSPQRAEQLAEQLEKQGWNARPAVFDVTKLDDISSFFESLGESPIHVLINNAYLGGGGTVECSSPSDYSKSYDVTVTAAHNMLKVALPSLRRAVAESGGASVINIGSMYGMVSPDPTVYATPEGTNPPYYGAAKAALIQWSKYAACEFGKEGIRVNALSPGPFPSEQVKESAPLFVNSLAKKVPLGRVGQSCEIEGPVLFLASTASSFVNGTNLVVDGGWISW